MSKRSLVGDSKIRVLRSTRRSLLTTILLGTRIPANAQPRRPQIGLLIGDAQPMIAAFRASLSQLGYIEGQNLDLHLRIHRREGELAQQAAELVRMKPELIVAAALPQALAIRSVDPTTIMVIATCPGMVSNGFAQSLEHPGGNVTGMEELPPGVTVKRLELLKTAAPRISRVALLSTTPGVGGHETQVEEAQKTAIRLALQVKPYRVQRASEIEPAFASMVQDKMEGILNFQGGLSLAQRDTIIGLAAKHRLPAIYQSALFPEAGGLMAWSPDQNEQFRQAARTVDKILRGAKPGEIPITYPAKYFLTINKKTAATLESLLSPALLSKADHILE